MEMTVITTIIGLIIGRITIVVSAVKCFLKWECQGNEPMLAPEMRQVLAKKLIFATTVGNAGN